MQSETSFALTSALSPQETERRRPTLHTLLIAVAIGAALLFLSQVVPPPNAFISASRGRTILPLLGGEGRGEGELHLFLRAYG